MGVRVPNATPSAAIVRSAILETQFLAALLLTTSLLIVSLWQSTAYAIAQQKEISEIFIEAEGNNKHEAKIKAHELGMQRALFLLADRLGIGTENLGAVGYEVLKNVFVPVVVNNELSIKEKYSATVTYSFSQGKFYNLLLRYGDSKVEDMFYEYLIIPVFKQSSFYNIWEPDKRWNDFWAESRQMLDTHKLYYPQKTLYTSKMINAENLMSLQYDDFIEVFKNKLFKGVLVVTAEFFTNRNSRESIIRVIVKILQADGSEPEIFEKDYPLNEMDDIAYTVDLVIDRIIDDFGMLRSVEVTDHQQDYFAEEEEEQKPIIMNFDVYDPDELEIVRDKLASVPQIESYRIEHDYSTRYKILIYTNVSEYELAEGLYLNGLSYKIHGNLYHLIDVKRGG